MVELRDKAAIILKGFDIWKTVFGGNVDDFVK